METVGRRDSHGACRDRKSLGRNLRSCVGLPWLFYAARFLFEEFEHAGFALSQAFLILLVLGGLFVTLFGLSQFLYREATVIDAEMVRWSRHGLSGTKSWREPVARYRDVLKDSQYGSCHDQPRTGYMEYRLTLHHDAATLSI